MQGHEYKLLELLWKEHWVASGFLLSFSFIAETWAQVDYFCTKCTFSLVHAGFGFKSLFPTFYSMWLMTFILLRGFTTALKTYRKYRTARTKPCLPSFQNHQIHLTVPPVGVYIIFLKQFWLHYGVSQHMVNPGRHLIADVVCKHLVLTAVTFGTGDFVHLFGWRASTKGF